MLVTYTRGLDLSGNLGAGLPRQSEATAGGIGGLLARTDASGSAFYHSDGAGNVTALMDWQEDIVARYMYGPFGKLIGQWGPMANANEMQFSSMPRDSLSGLSFYPFRAYEPNFQRWLNQDPIQEMGGINLYRAMNNDPLNEVDPLGLLSGIEEQEAQVAEEAAGEGNAGDEFGPLGYLAAAGLAVSAGFLTADSAEAYQWIQQNQQTAQNDLRIQQMEQQLQEQQELQRGVSLGEGEWIDQNGNVRDQSGNLVRDKLGRDIGKPANLKGPCKLQSNGHTLKPSTVNALNNYFGTDPNDIDWGQALENMKQDNLIPNDFHNTDIYNDGDVYLNQPAGELPSGTYLGNLSDYLH